jgi:REP element-mobilizing transposase RayT
MPDADHIPFGVFDPAAEVDRSERNLPHWFQPGDATFITFRTADSLPRAVLSRWHAEQKDWLQRHGLPTGVVSSVAEEPDLPPSLHKAFRRYREERWHWHLDRWHGECLLREPDLAAIVGSALRHFDGDRYDLDSFVVMPNHVHVLVQFCGLTDCRRQCASWLRYSAGQINKQRGRSGQFWQSEPFDHLVRSEEQFRYLQSYIEQNPAKARLQPGEYLLWQR